MATAKVALSSLMDTVTAIGNSGSALINTTTKGIGMLDAIVTKSATEQKLRHKASAKTFLNNLIREASENEAVAKLSVIDFCSKSVDHKNMYESAFNEFSELFAEELGTKASE